MSTNRPSRALLWAILGAVVGLWAGYAVVAGVSKGSPQPASHGAAVAAAATPVGFALSKAPALQVRRKVMRHKRVHRRAVHRRAVHRRVRHKRVVRRAPARRVVAPAPPAMSIPATPAVTPAPVTPVQAAPAPRPAPRPAPKPRPKLTAKPTKPARPDFDQSSPGGFDNSG
jgi:hypothetical protein